MDRPRAVRWPSRFAVITAWATTGEQWSEARNQTADQALQRELRHLWHLRLTGYSPTTGHAEPGYACALAPDEAQRLGRQFLQDAIYLIENDTLLVVRCAADEQPAQVGSFRERLDQP